MRACEEEKTDIVQVLLEKGATVAYKGKVHSILRIIEPLSHSPLNLVPKESKDGREPAMVFFLM